MEPGGRNQWQPVANPDAPKTADLSQAAGCDHLPIGAHGKEGVDGSSPSEGSCQRERTIPFPRRQGAVRSLPYLDQTGQLQAVD